MKTLFVSAIISVLSMFSTAAETLEYCIFKVQGDTPAGAEIIRLYEADLLSPSIKGSAQIQDSGGFKDENIQEFQYVTKFDSAGNPTEMKAQELGYRFTGTAKETTGFVGVDFSFKDIRKLADTFYPHQNGKIMPQPILQTHALQSYVTLNPNSEWVVIGSGSLGSETGLMIALRIKK